MARDNGITAGRTRLLTLSQASRMLSVHPNTLRRWSDNGTLKAYRIGPRRDRRFNLDEINKFLEERSLVPVR